MKVLCLPEWYPTKISPYNGDFLQRHIKAIRIYNEVQVIHVLRDTEGRITKDVKMEEQFSENLNEKIIYYFSPRFTFPGIDKFFSALKYRRLYRQAVRNYIRQSGKPELIHVHIAFKAGIIARWIKRRWGIPYVMSEHWTGYLPGADEKFSDIPFYFKYPWRKVLRTASSISVVSSYLGQCLQKIFPGIHFIVIPNVVDTNIFSPRASGDNDVTRFIHISVLNYQKNAEDMLKAFSILKQKRSDFQLSIIGPHCENLIKLVNELELPSHVDFHPEVPQNELVKWMHQSEALILYSRYETFGCVIIEAQACGLPVILTDIPVMHENAKEGFNAVFALNENPGDLAERLEWFIMNRQNFDTSSIAQQAASNYNYKKIGMEFTAWYSTVLKKN